MMRWFKKRPANLDGCRAFDWVMRVITSCNTNDQLRISKELIENYNRQFPTCKHFYVVLLKTNCRRGYELAGDMKAWDDFSGRFDLAYLTIGRNAKVKDCI